MKTGILFLIAFAVHSAAMAAPYFSCVQEDAYYGKSAVYLNTRNQQPIRVFATYGVDGEDIFNNCNVAANQLTGAINRATSRVTWSSCTEEQTEWGTKYAVYLKTQSGQSIRAFAASGVDDEDRSNACNYYANQLTRVFAGGGQ